MATDEAAVLVVDDEPLNVDLLQQELGDAGCRTVCAANGEQAIALAAKAQPDLILLDLMMSGIDGYETCARLKASAATRALPVNMEPESPFADTPPSPATDLRVSQGPIAGRHEGELPAEELHQHLDKILVEG